ncbi:unnamed protein product [Caenorhabditis nigoni]
MLSSKNMLLNMSPERYTFDYGDYSGIANRYGWNTHNSSETQELWATTLQCRLFHKSLPLLGEANKNSEP